MRRVTNVLDGLVGTGGGGADGVIHVGWRGSAVPASLGRRIAAALLAFAAAVLAMLSLREREPSVAVAVAAHDLAAGARLGPGDVTVVQLPRSLAPAGTRTSAAPLIGQVVAGRLRAREPLTDSRLAAAGLAGGLRPGEVAAPIRLVDPDVGALLQPGLVVDVLAAGSSPVGPDRAGQSAARLVAAGARVLDVPSASSATSTGTGTLVVLAVTSDQAEQLAGAQAAGRLSVVLRGG